MIPRDPLVFAATRAVAGFRPHHPADAARVGAVPPAATGAWICSANQPFRSFPSRPTTPSMPLQRDQGMQPRIRPRGPRFERRSADPAHRHPANAVIDRRHVPYLGDPIAVCVCPLDALTGEVVPAARSRDSGARVRAIVRWRSSRPVAASARGQTRQPSGWPPTCDAATEAPPVCRYGRSVPAKTCQASADFATRLRIMYARSPYR